MSASPHLRLVEPGGSPAEETEGGVGPQPAKPMSLEEAFRAYGRYVGWIGTRILGRPEDVDDLVQDVFVDAAKGLETVRDPDATKAWLATLAVRKARRMLEKRRRRRFFGLDEGADYSRIVGASAAGPARVAIADLYRMLDELPVDERLAWTLRHLEKKPLKEVANLCGCSLATAKRRVAAAHSVLGEEFGHD